MEYISKMLLLKKEGLTDLENRLTDLEKELMVTRVEGIVRELGMDIYTLLYLSG